MKRAIIILNGRMSYDNEFYKKYIKKEDDIFCADGGSNYAYELKLKPKLILGDLDSIREDVLNYYKKEKIKFKKYPPEKDKTDTELIIEEVKKLEKYNKIIILGGLGGRVDHTLVNIQLLERYKIIKFVNSKEEIEFLENEEKILKDKKNKIISLIPISKKVEVKKLEGFKYDGENLIFERGNSLGISNVVEKNEAKIKIKKGKILLIINQKKEM
ncbi:MAG: thiamine diphosphokinase [Fusobacteriia bacterium 4572_132]|nr:MAG: thiamine diphosphokinase [Fusobacteriia bacterium 4572_132]